MPVASAGRGRAVCAPARRVRTGAPRPQRLGEVGARLCQRLRRRRRRRRRAHKQTNKQRPDRRVETKQLSGGARRRDIIFGRSFGEYFSIGARNKLHSAQSCATRIDPPARLWLADFSSRLSSLRRGRTLFRATWSPELVERKSPARARARPASCQRRAFISDLATGVELLAAALRAPHF